MDNQYLLGIFLVMGVATFMTRLLPFVALTQSQSSSAIGAWDVIATNDYGCSCMFWTVSLQIASLDRLGLVYRINCRNDITIEYW